MQVWTLQNDVKHGQHEDGKNDGVLEQQPNEDADMPAVTKLAYTKVTEEDTEKKSPEDDETMGEMNNKVEPTDDELQYMMHRLAELDPNVEAEIASATDVQEVVNIMNVAGDEMDRVCDMGFAWLITTIVTRERQIRQQQSTIMPPSDLPPCGKEAKTTGAATVAAAETRARKWKKTSTQTTPQKNLQS